MRFSVEYPVSAAGYDPALLTRSGLTTVARAVETAGFDAIGFTEHPAPSQKWMSAGGHDTLDVVAALSFCAAVTSTLTLMPYLLVLPYYNAFALAKSLTTLDVISDGRLLVVAGTGYLRSEFLALSVDMEARNDRFDESVEVMRGAWSTVPFTHEGTHFTGRGVAQRPMPRQVGGPRILVGGNGRLARRRAAELDGWSPLLIQGPVTATVRTPPLDLAGFARGVAAIRDRSGRDDLEFQVQSGAARYLSGGSSVEQHRDHLGELSTAGATRFVVQPPGCAPEALVDRLLEYGETFIT
jgi:probable F420-dependent oxidoreductase